MSNQNGILQRKCACGQHTIAGDECEECRQKHEGMMRRAAISSTPVNTVPQIVHDVLSSPDQSLDADTRSFMELRLGHDFSQVRVHTDSQAAESARPLNRLSSGLGRNHRQRVWFDPQVDSRLPDYTPAWTEKGNIHLSTSSLFMSPVERQRMLRHEAIHSYHQQLAPPSETAGTREHAERIATHGEQNLDGLNSVDFLYPAPALLAYPPQKYIPWTTLWIGYPGLIGEVVELGVSVRIFKSYDDIKEINYQSYQCGKHDKPPIQEVAKKMQRVARKAVELNAKIPETATEQRIALVTIFGDSSSSAFRVANGKGLLIVAETDFDAGKFEDTIAHEGAHAIFEHHSVQRDSAKRIPDAFALHIADLFIELSKTRTVPIPTAKFDPKSRPPLVATEESGKPAGLVMVMDTLWSGEGGHPWQGVDEFFASAYGGFLQQPKLLQQIVSYYQTADKNIKPLTEKLFKLLAMVGSTKDLKKLAEPAKPKLAQDELKGIGAAPDESASAFGVLSWLIDPSNMPAPDTILCSSSTPSANKPAKDPLDFDIP
jgi:hypothetical protein